MSPTRSWILFGTGKTQQHIPCDLLPWHLLSPGNLKCGIAIVQKGNIAGSQRMSARAHPLVPGRADGIETLSCLLHRPAGSIQRTAKNLRTKERHGLRLAEARTRGNTCWEIPGGDSGLKVFMHDLGAIHDIPLVYPGWACARTIACQICRAPDNWVQVSVTI
jgi:hypothetical protein